MVSAIYLVTTVTQITGSRKEHKKDIKLTLKSFVTASSDVAFEA